MFSVSGIKNTLKHNLIFIDLLSSQTALILSYGTHSSPNLKEKFISEYHCGQCIFHSPPLTTSVGGVAIHVMLPNIILSNIVCH